MGYTLKVISQFNAAHNLREYDGKCENLHGHNWKVELEVAGAEPGDSGMLVDFKELKGILNDILERFDHKYINELEPFKRSNPTSENIAKYIYDEAKRALGKKVKAAAVSVWETDAASARYAE